MPRNLPYEVEPVNPRKRERHPAPTGNDNVALQGFERITQADPRTGVRPATGGRPVYHPQYHEDQ